MRHDLDARLFLNLYECINGLLECSRIEVRDGPVDFAVLILHHADDADELMAHQSCTGLTTEIFDRDGRSREGTHRILKCAPEFGHENGGAFGTRTHALAECFSRHWPSNSAGVKYPSDEWIRLRL